MKLTDEQWLKRHYATIGGSTAAAACGMSEWKSQSKLYDLMVADQHEDVDTPDMRRGHENEPTARRKLSEKLGVRIVSMGRDDYIPGGEDYPWAHVEPDGWADVRSTGASDGVPVEVKCPRPAKVAKIRLRGLQSNPDWYLQCQHTLALTGAPFMYFGMYDVVECELHAYTVRQDYAAIVKMMAAEEAFFALVQARQRPSEDPLDAPEAIPTPPDDMRTITSEVTESVVQTVMRLRRLKDDAGEALDEAKARLGELCDDQVFECGGVRCHHKPGKNGTRVWRFYEVR